MDKKVKYGIGVVVALAVVAGSFYGGMVYKGNQAQAKTLGTQRAGATGTRFAAAANFIAGSVVSKDDQSITVKMRDGSSKIIFYSPTTEVTKYAAGAMADVQVGSTIMVSGKTNSDGSVTASSIQLRPAGLVGPGAAAPQ